MRASWKVDFILLNEIDESNEWLVKKNFDKYDENNKNEYIFFKTDGLTYKVVASASRTGSRRLELQRYSHIKKLKHEMNLFWYYLLL